MDAIIDYDAINNKVFASRDYRIKSKELATKYVDGFLARKKNELLGDLNRHVITQEIDAGASSQNTSGTLAGNGNLFSFIGFYAESRPTDKLRELLSSIKYTEPKFKNNMWVFEIPIPDDKAIIAATPMPWQPGAGWAIEVEKGISGLGHYLNVKSVRSRSGGGLQVKAEVRLTSDSARRPYISPLLDDFRVNLTRFR